MVSPATILILLLENITLLWFIYNTPHYIRSRNTVLNWLYEPFTTRPYLKLLERTDDGKK